MNNSNEASNPAKGHPAASSLLHAAAGIALVVAGGVVHGQFTQRWGVSSDANEAVEVVESMPERVGVWRLEESPPLSPVVVGVLRCEGYVNRVYMNLETNETVTVTAIVGPPGPTAVHRPEICFDSQDYSLESGPTETVIDAGGPEHRFWASQFKSNQPGGPRQHLYYAWSDGDTWEAPESPRFAFGGRPWLHKLTVSTSPPVGSSGSNDDPCLQFLHDLLESGWKPLGPAL